MKDISDLEVRQTRIFPIDTLPITRLLTPAVMKGFNERFGWGGTETVEGDIVLKPGFFPGPDAKDAVIIRSLQFNMRRLILSVVGDSATANIVFDAIATFFEDQAQWTRTEPIVLVEDTGCVVTLAFDWTALVAPAFREFALGTMERFGKYARPEIRGMGFGLRFAYPAVPPELQERGVTLGERVLTIEPRLNVPLAERRYYTNSPSDSDTHIALLESLEHALSQGGKSGAKR